MGGIYKIENTINGKCYYGQTTRKVRRRLKDHETALKTGRHENSRLQRSYNKHGASAFIFITIDDNLPNDQLNSIEIKLIDIFNTTDERFGYNQNSGGYVGRVASEELRKRLSESAIKKFQNPNYTNPIKGKPKSQEHKEQLSRGLKSFYTNGGVSPTLGRQMTPEQVERNKQIQRALAKAPGYKNPGQGKPLSEDTKLKISATKRAANNSSHNATTCVGPDGFIWPTIGLAAKSIGTCRVYLARAIDAGRSVKGNKFEYLIPKT